MLRFRQTALHGTCIVLAAGSIAACTASPRPALLLPQSSPRQVVGQDAAGFMIRIAEPGSVTPAASPQAPVMLGDTVRIDRNALIPTHAKDIPHGETR